MVSWGYILVTILIKEVLCSLLPQFRPRDNSDHLPNKTLIFYPLIGNILRAMCFQKQPANIGPPVCIHLVFINMFEINYMIYF